MRQEEDRWIDVHDDKVIQEMGLMRTNPVVPRDKTVWSKTSAERRNLQKAKDSEKKREMRFSTFPIKHVPIKDKLIIYLYKNSVYPKTTYSAVCWQHEIPFILSKYVKVNFKLNTATNLVAKYSFNGKTYSRNELPFWGVK